MNINQLSEHLKDIPQNTLVGYAQNPNSVVPQFLALAEIQRRQQLQAPTQAPASTVANDVLSQANPQPAPMPPQGIAQMQQQPAPEQMAQQLPENQPGVAQLPSGMAPKGFAGGGIVAFAGGGQPPPEAEDDEEYQDYLDKRDSSKRRNGVNEIYSMLKDRVAGAVGAIPQKYEEATQYLTGSKGSSEDRPSGIESLLAKVRQLESGGRHYDSSGKVLTSSKGAEGEMQVMPHTQKDPGYGVMPARDKSPQELKRVGEEYFVAMLNRFQDPKVAAMAYNWGPGNVEKWLASGQKTPVPKETLKYRSHFAQGGIAHFAKGSQDEPIKTSDYYASSEADDRMFAAPAKVGINSLNASYEDADKYRSPTATTPTAPLSEYDLFIKQLAKERADTAADHASDKDVALMQAGLGMLSGSSPYALQNIGQGGMQGVAAYQAAQKQRAAELAAIRKAEGTALEGKQLYEAKKYAQEQLSDYRKDRIAQNQEKIDNAATVAQDAADLKRRTLLDTARKTAQNDDNYQQYAKLIKELEQIDPADPKIDQYRAKQNAIVESYVQSSLKGEWVPPVFPKIAPAESSSSTGNIFTRFLKSISQPSAPTSDTVDTNNRLLK